VPEGFGGGKRAAPRWKPSSLGLGVSGRVPIFPFVPELPDPEEFEEEEAEADDPPDWWDALCGF